jgi:hypothetical protein
MRRGVDGAAVIRQEIVVANAPRRCSVATCGLPNRAAEGFAAGRVPA